MTEGFFPNELSSVSMTRYLMLFRIKTQPMSRWRSLQFQTMLYNGENQLIGLRQKLRENPIIFMGKSGWFPVKIFPFLSTHWEKGQFFQDTSSPSSQSVHRSHSGLKHFNTARSHQSLRFWIHEFLRDRLDLWLRNAHHSRISLDGWNMLKTRNILKKGTNQYGWSFRLRNRSLCSGFQGSSPTASGADSWDFMARPAMVRHLLNHGLMGCLPPSNWWFGFRTHPQYHTLSYIKHHG